MSDWNGQDIDMSIFSHIDCPFLRHWNCQFSSRWSAFIDLGNSRCICAIIPVKSIWCDSIKKADHSDFIQFGMQKMFINTLNRTHKNGWICEHWTCEWGKKASSTSIKISHTCRTLNDATHNQDDIQFY